jgi:hypothetical protein
MKLLYYLIPVAILFNACKDKNKVVTTEKNEDGTTTTTSVNVKGMQESVDEMSKKIEELKQMKPMTMEELKAILPEQLNGIAKTNYSANSTMGFSVVEGEYKKDDTTSIKVSVYDCAGEAGSGIYSLNYFTKMNFEQESSDGYTKSVDFMGGKAVEEFKKNENRSTLTYTAKDRLLVTLTGENVSMDDLKKAAGQLNTK